MVLHISTSTTCLNGLKIRVKMIHSFLRQRTLLCRTAITLRSIPVPPVQRTFSSNTPPKSNKKNLVPAPPPTSFLIPLANLLHIYLLLVSLFDLFDPLGCC